MAVYLNKPSFVLIEFHCLVPSVNLTQKPVRLTLPANTHSSVHAQTAQWRLAEHTFAVQIVPQQLQLQISKDQRQPPRKMPRAHYPQEK